MILIEDTYKRLRQAYLNDYKFFWGDTYRGQNQLSRKATLYAVTNTIRVWREEARGENK